MWKQADERWNRRALLALLLLGAVDRLYLLLVFGFRYIGIDDALIQQVAIDYGNGIFREPFLYGQNYNPMLEALLAAPFVRLGAAPWVVLPVVTSVLALLPFWSMAWWCARKQRIAAALGFALLPLLLPVEWGMMTSMSRGFVHGIALLALVPWLQELKSPVLKQGVTALTLVAALFCNPNALPLVVGIAVWLAWHNARSILFWSMHALALALAFVVHWKTQAYFDPRPLIHPLTTSDLQPRVDLFWSGSMDLDSHFLHVNPFGGMAALVLLGLWVDAFSTWRSGQRAGSLALTSSLLVIVVALSVVKVHEGCSSVFFPKSRMFLSLPLIIGVAAMFTLERFRSWRMWVPLAVVLSGITLVTLKVSDTEEVIHRELAEQSCAYVREESLVSIRERCQHIADAATKAGAEVVVPIRWPGIGVDHHAHFQAHFICYACEQLVKDFPPSYGAGFDRRNWRATAYEHQDSLRVLLVGGDPAAWIRLEQTGMLGNDLGDHGTAMHMVTTDSTSLNELIMKLGVDDDLGR